MYTKLKPLAVLGILVVLLGGFVLWDTWHAASVHVPGMAMVPYSSEDGVSFMYPSGYTLSSATHTSGNQTWDSLVLVDKTYTPVQNSDGPQSMSLSVFSNTDGLPLDQFVKNDTRSNYQLSAEGTLTPGTVGGKPSLSYQYSGLYENDAVAVLHNGKVFIFSDSWSQTIDPIRHDFNAVLSSVQFQ